MKKWRNKILSAVLTLSLLLTSTSFAFAVGEGGTTEENLVQIPRTQLSIAGFSSQQYKPTGDTGTNSEESKNEGPATNAIDGNTGTFWHTIWTGTDPETNMSAGNDHDKYIIIDLGGNVYLKKFKLIPRQGQNAQSDVLVKNYAVYTSTQLNENNEPLFNGDATVGNFTSPNNNSGNFVVFSEPVLARYVKIQATDGNTYATIAELEFFMDPIYNPSIVTQPQSASYTVNDDQVQPLTVSATQANGGASVSYQWYKNTSKNYNGTAIENANSELYTPDVNTPGNYYYYVAVTDSETNATIYSDIATIGVAESGVSYAAMVDCGYYNDLSTAITEADNGDTVTVLKNIDLTSGIEITNKTITIKSKENDNGNYIIKRSVRFDTFLFKINGSADVTFENITIDGGKNINVSTTGTLINVSGGQATLGEGTVLQNNNHTGGGGGAAMYISGGITNLDGATIQDNVATRNGIIYMNGGTVNVNYCEITNNKADNGGAIYMDSGIANLNGGTITNNTATTNGGAVYVNGGTLNVGQAEKDFALTISENTATSYGSGIYYGKGTNPAININAKLNLHDEIYFDTNGVNINLNCDLTGNAPITLFGDKRGINTLIYIYKEYHRLGALNVFRVKDGTSASLKPTKMTNSDLCVVRESNWSITKALENGSTYYKGIENNLYTVTGANIYTWYEKGKDGSFSTVDMNTLSNGEHTVYCVASDGTNYMVSDVATVTVKDFVPCSQAIDKFKSI